LIPAGLRAAVVSPLDRQRHTPAAPVAFPAAEPRFQVEHLHRSRQPEPDQQADARDQLIVAASDALDAEEIAVAKVSSPPRSEARTSNSTGTRWAKGTIERAAYGLALRSYRIPLWQPTLVAFHRRSS
jgi:hypothetical protein